MLAPALLEKRLKAELAALQKANKACFNCSALANYAIFPPAITVCAGCASLHRNLGHHAKGFGASNFSKEDVGKLQAYGNEVASGIWLAKIPAAVSRPASGDTEACQRWIQRVFRDSEFHDVVAEDAAARTADARMGKTIARVELGTTGAPRLAKPPPPGGSARSPARSQTLQMQPSLSGTSSGALCTAGSAVAPDTAQHATGQAPPAPSSAAAPPPAASAADAGSKSKSAGASQDQASGSPSGSPRGQPPASPTAAPAAAAATAAAAAAAAAAAVTTTKKKKKAAVADPPASPSEPPPPTPPVAGTAVPSAAATGTTTTKKKKKAAVADPQPNDSEPSPAAVRAGAAAAAAAAAPAAPPKTKAKKKKAADVGPAPSSEQPPPSAAEAGAAADAAVAPSSPPAPGGEDRPAASEVDPPAAEPKTTKKTKKATKPKAAKGEATAAECSLADASQKQEDGASGAEAGATEGTQDQQAHRGAASQPESAAAPTDTVPEGAGAAAAPQAPAPDLLGGMLPSPQPFDPFAGGAVPPPTANLQALPDAIVDPFAPKPTPDQLAPVATSVHSAAPEGVPTPSAAYGAVSALQPFDPFQDAKPQDVAPGMPPHAPAAGPYGPSPIVPGAAPPLHAPPSFWGQPDATPAPMHTPGLQNSATRHEGGVYSHMAAPSQVPAGGAFTGPAGGPQAHPGSSLGAGQPSFPASSAQSFPPQGSGVVAPPGAPAAQPPNSSGGALQSDGAGALAPSTATAPPQPHFSSGAQVGGAALATVSQHEMKQQPQHQQQHAGAGAGPAGAAAAPATASSAEAAGAQAQAPQLAPAAAELLPSAASAQPRPPAAGSGSPTARAPLRAELFASPQVAAQVSAQQSMQNAGFGMPHTGQGYSGMPAHAHAPAYAAAATGFGPQGSYFAAAPHMQQHNGAAYGAAQFQSGGWAPAPHQPYGAAPTGYMQPHMMHGQHAPMPGHPGMPQQPQQWGQSGPAQHMGGMHGGSQPNMHMPWPHASQPGGQQAQAQPMGMGMQMNQFAGGAAVAGNGFMGQGQAAQPLVNPAAQAGMPQNGVSGGAAGPMGGNPFSSGVPGQGSGAAVKSSLPGAFARLGV